MSCCPQVWSAFREPSFGHGLMDFVSDTTVVWNWQRNQDALGAKTGDTVRDPSKSCCGVDTF